MRRTLQLTAALAGFLLAIRALAFGFAWPARALYESDLEAQQTLSRGMDRWVATDLAEGDFGTGSARFDGEWLFMTRMMGVLGYGQLAIEHPELAPVHAERMNHAVDALISERSRAFDREAWGYDPLSDLGSSRAHVGYLGYLALALAMTRFVDPETRHSALEQEVVDHLVACFEASSTGVLATYPNEAYPIDNTSFVGALAVHDRVTGQDHGALIARLVGGLATRYRDPHSGLLYQSVDPDDGAPLDLPRGSGTGLAAYFLSFADADLSRLLYESMRAELLVQTLGFGTTREYPSGHAGFGDIDSGPVLFGQGVSATGFTLALARVHADRDTFEATYATASFFGGRVGGHYAMGGPLGDALLFAFCTALPTDRWRDARPGDRA